MNKPSEFNTKPPKIIMHSPERNEGIMTMTVDDLERHNFLELPNKAIMIEQFNNLRKAIEDEGIEVLELLDLLDEKAAQAAAKNPNSIFMRDPVVTIPWLPGFYIPCNMILDARREETEIAAVAMKRLGLKPLIELDEDEYVEGGDVLPIVHNGLRTLLIGFGSRTTQSVAVALANKLIPEHIDQVLGIKHDKNVLHLDTGFTFLPNEVMFQARGMFTEGFLINKDKQLSEIHPIAFVEEMGFTIVRTTKKQAVRNERCNLLPVGNNRYFSFTMPAELKEELEEKASIKIIDIEGDEIAKATGGVHCLTRPIF